MPRHTSRTTLDKPKPDTQKLLAGIATQQTQNLRKQFLKHFDPGGRFTDNDIAAMHSVLKSTQKPAKGAKKIKDLPVGKKRQLPIKKRKGGK